MLKLNHTHQCPSVTLGTVKSVRTMERGIFLKRKVTPIHLKNIAPRERSRAKQPYTVPRQICDALMETKL